MMKERAMKYALAAGLALLALTTMAGVRSDKAAPAATTEVEPLTQDYRAPSKAPRASNKGPSLRCWQYGRLIFEEPMAELPASLAGGHKFEGRSGASVQLLDMHNAICLMK